MKAACIFLTLERTDLTIRCIKQNFYNSGMDADVFLIDSGTKDLTAITNAYPHFKKVFQFKKNKGIAAAINKGLSLVKSSSSKTSFDKAETLRPFNYDAVVTLANDILMPNDWLKLMVEYAELIPGTGMVGIHCVEELPPLTDGVHYASPVFGNVLITKQALDKVGGYNTDFDPYGQQDADYGYRVKLAGLKQYYLPNLKAEHIGHDAGNGTEYRKMKDEGLIKAKEIWESAKKGYDETGIIFIKY